MSSHLNGSSTRSSSNNLDPAVPSREIQDGRSRLSPQRNATIDRVSASSAVSQSLVQSLIPSVSDTNDVETAASADSGLNISSGDNLQHGSPSRMAAVDPNNKIVGNSSAINIVRDVATSIAPRRSTVMLLGETGTGKEMLARHIHDYSERAGKPFVPVDCSAMTESLFESQLFGHVRGAFTGAVRESLGFVRAADGGTLFIDEVGELSILLQAKLLRVLQERCVVPVGDTRPRSVDVRVICATHRDLPKMVRMRTFREDLYFRLNVVVLHVPPLRERPDDVVPLAQHFLAVQADLYGETSKTLSQEASLILRQYPWPGNVRELANVIEHAHVLASAGVIRPTDLPERLRELADPRVATPSDLRLIDVERRTIAEALHRTKFCKAAASRLLGINIQRLSRRIRALGIEIPDNSN